jgi:nitrite reductase/ring-hydroxylating ferredoxin subunit
MSGRVWIGRELPPIRRNGEEYFLLSVDDRLYLAPNRCPHRGGPLKFGHVDGEDRIVCPMHHNAVPVETIIAWSETIALGEEASGER